MTHTLHRTGDIESLKEDFPMLTHVARGYNDIGAGERLKQMAEIARKYTDLNFGDCKVANKFMMPPEQIMEKHTVGWQVVFKDKKSLIACMKELKEKNIGISVVVSGLFDEVFECCQKAGINPPLIEFALGIHGNKERSGRRRSLISSPCVVMGWFPVTLSRKWWRISRRKRSRLRKRPWSWRSLVCVVLLTLIGQPSF